MYDRAVLVQTKVSILSTVINRLSFVAADFRLRVGIFLAAKGRECES